MTGSGALSLSCDRNLTGFFAIAQRALSGALCSQCAMRTRRSSSPTPKCRRCVTRPHHWNARFKDCEGRAGERIAKHILITRYDSARAAGGEMLSIDDVLEILAVPLLGIIPESQDVLRASNVGSPVTLTPPARRLAPTPTRCVA